MATTQEYALLSLYVYKVVREAINRPNLPQGWTVLEAKDDNLLGFSYGVFKRSGTNEVVLAYTGTNSPIDWVSNFTAGSGLPSWQVSNAALVYEQVKEKYGSNITLSGHSLGGGLASVMATWFNRPAVVFDEAPFQLTAANPVMLALVRAQLVLAGYSDAMMDNAISDFSARETQVANHYLEGEVLNALRFAANTVAGSDNRIDINGGQAGAVQLHSLALLSAATMSDSFRLATYASTSIVPLLMDEKLRSFNTGTSLEKNFLVDLIRSEQSAVAGQGKLTHFANDLNKLGANAAGLNKAAQDALIAQGIEWYYWQDTDYAGQEFFSKTGELLQYSSAQGDALPGAQNKASQYVRTWLDQTYTASTGDTRFAPMGTAFDQWSVCAGSAGVTATARNAAKSQIFMGKGGADSFTGGEQSDVIMAGGGNDTLSGGAGFDLLYGGAGNDTLDGGTGSDRLYGGAGADTYNFSGNWGSDTITDDSAGQGSVVIDGVTLQGGKKIAGFDNAWQNKDQGYSFALAGSGAGKVLVITKDGSLNTIRVQGWQNSQLGLSMDDTPAEAPSISHTYNGDQRAPLNASGSYDWGATSWLADGTLSGGVAEAGFADVITGTAGNDKIAGLGLGDCENKWHRNAQKQNIQYRLGCSSPQNAHACSMRFAAHKRLGWRIDVVQAISGNFYLANSAGARA